MMEQNDWLNSEIYDLKLDNFKKGKRDMQVFKRLMIVLLPLFLFTVALPAYSAIQSYRHPKSVFWTCQRCRTSQWQDSANRDWRGEYYCRNCGLKK